MRFYHSLRFKITILFVALMILGNFTALFLANQRVADSYSRYISQADRQRAAMAARFLEGNWDRWKNDLSRLTGPVMGDRSMMNRQGGMGMGRSMMFDRNDPIIFAVTDARGKILFYSGSRENVPEHIAAFKEGAPIAPEGITEAYVLAGSMIGNEMNRSDRAMLREINRVLILTYILSTLTILVLGILLLGRMLSPLKEIEKAAADLGRGNYRIRTGVSGTDEIGLLGIRFDGMAQSLEDSEEWKRRIIADTAHELRTPVALLLSRLEMIRDGIYPADDAQLNMLYRETRNFSRLIGEMQKLAGMEAGTVSLEKSEGDGTAFCYRILQTFLPESRKEGKTLLWEGQPLTPETPSPASGGGNLMKADWYRLEQVLTNILSNALRHTPSPGRVEICSTLRADRLLITVGDSGPGIPPRDRDRIFDRFFRLDSSRNRQDGGYGLGLAISRAIVEAHGGEIGVGESSLGGAEFRIELPR
jgi:signal transduction histidine kinase